MNVLPASWTRTTIGEVADLETGNTPSKKNPDNFGGPYPFYKPGDLDVSRLLDRVGETLSEQGYSVSRQLPAGTVLVSCIGNLGKSGITTIPATCNQQINAILPNDAAVAEYIYLWTKTIKPWMEENASATTVTILNKGRFSAAPIPLPPLAEQRRIVDKLDWLSAHSQSARDHLARVATLATRAKQATLAAAFRGELTVDWQTKTVADVLSDSLIGLVRSKTEQSENGAPYIRMNHFDMEGRWNSDSLTHVATTGQELARFELRPRDLLFNTRNSAELVGKVALWPSDRKGHVYNNNILRMRFKEDVVPEFAFAYMISPQFRGYLETVKSATTSVAAIYQKSLLRGPFPVPSTDEQQEIVRRIEVAFARINRMAAEAARAAGLLDRLDERLLAKAFRGELVPQDPTDEPASELLARIRQARAAAPKPKRKSKK